VEEQEEEQEEEEGEEEEDVYEVELNNNIYYVTNEIDGLIFKQDLEGDVGDEIGYFKDGVAIFN